MKRQKMNVVALLVGICVIQAAVYARVPMRQDARLYNQGRLAGHADAVMHNARLSARQKEEALQVIFAEYEKLHMADSTDAQQIKAHLGLAKVQVDVTKSYVEREEALEEETAPESGAEGDVSAYDLPAPEAEALPAVEPADAPEEVLSGDMPIAQVASFGMEVIKNAAKYSNRLQCVGMPTVSHHRELTFRLFLDAAASEAGMRGQVAMAKRVMEELEKERAQAESGLAKFIASFKTHLEKKYGTVTDGIEQEIFFKIFQNVAYEDDAGPSIADAVGVFLDAYNTYVQEKLRFTPEELTISTGKWGQAILGKDKNLAARLKLLLVSFSMEEIKRDLKREPLMKKLNDAVSEQVKKGADLLTKEGIALEGDAARAPMAVAMKCAEIVKKKVDEAGGQLTPALQKSVEEYFSVADQISYLSNDCDMVSREMADIESIFRIRSEIAQLPAQDQQLIKQSSAIEKAALDEMVPGIGQPSRGHSLAGSRLNDDKEAQDASAVPTRVRTTGPNKKTMLLVAIGVLVAGALLLHKFKPEAFSWFGGRSSDGQQAAAASGTAQAP